MKQNFGIKILLILQLALSAFACGYLLFCVVDPIGIIFCIPFWLLSFICLIGIIAFTLAKKLRSLFFATIISNIVLLALFAIGLMLGGRQGYYSHMNRRTCDTIPYRMIPDRFVADNSVVIAEAFVVHNIKYKRKHIFSKEFENLKNTNPYDWNDFYSLILKHENLKKQTARKTEIVDSADLNGPDISSLNITIVNVPADSLIWQGEVADNVKFDFANGAIPNDTIKLLIKQNNKNDSILLVKQ